MPLSYELFEPRVLLLPITQTLHADQHQLPTELVSRVECRIYCRPRIASQRLVFATLSKFGERPSNAPNRT